MGLFAGDTIVLMPRFDPHEIWRAVERYKINLMAVVGDAMARPLIDAYHGGGYDASSVIAFSSTAALFSPVVKEACAKARPHLAITAPLGSPATRFPCLPSL